MDNGEYKTDIPTEISKHVSEWKRFGRFLKFCDERLNHIKTKHSKCYDRVYTIMTEFCHPEPLNNSWSFWKKYLLEYPEGDKIIKEIETNVPEVINEAADSTCHSGICQNNGLLFHHHMLIEKDKPLPISSEKQIAVNIGGGDVKLFHYQDYEDFMKTKADYFKLYQMLSDIKAFDFTISDQKKCPILNSIRCFLEQSKHDGFVYKGYSLRNHYTLFGKNVVPQEEVNNNILAYFSNDNVLIHIKTCDNIKEISRTLNSFSEDVKFAQAVHECVFNNLIIHIGVVLVDDNILNDNNVFVCHQCVKNCLILPKSTFSNEGRFKDWYDKVIKRNESIKRTKNTLTLKKEALNNDDISLELKRNILSQMALKSFAFPSFTPLPNYQMKELEKVVQLTASQMEILHSPHKNIMIKENDGSGKSLVSQPRLKNDIPRKISEHVSEWKEFGRFLGISDGRLNQIEIENFKCYDKVYDRVYSIMTESCYPKPFDDSWSFWKKKLLQYPEGDKIIREIEITVPEVINEAADSTYHSSICQNNALLFHHQMSIEKDKPLPISTEKQIAVNIGGGGVELLHYQDYKDFMKTRVDYFNLYEMFSDIKTYDFTTCDQKKCQILNSIQCFIEQSKHDGFAYKGYSLRNHYTLFGEYDVPQEEVNNNILAYFSNDNVLIHIKTCDNIKDISRTLNSFLQDVQFAQAVHECVSNNPIIHIGVVLVDDNILNDNNALICYQCMKNYLILPTSTFSNEEGFKDWYDKVIKKNECIKQTKNILTLKKEALDNDDISLELKRNIISQMALKSFDFPSFTPLSDYQMKELEKLVLLTAEQMEILHSPHKHIMIKGSYGSGKSLVLQQRFKQALQESGDDDIFYLICHDQMSEFAKQMKLMLNQYPDKLILVCNSREISSIKIMNISDLLKYIREMWRGRRVHVFVDEFNGEYLDKDEVYKIMEEMNYFRNSHIVIAVQSMEYTFYKKSNFCYMEKDGTSNYYKLLAKETSFCVYQLEYSFRCSVEINTFVNAMTNYLSDEDLKFVKTENALNIYQVILDRELTLENDSYLRHDTDTDIYYRYCYNTVKYFGHNVFSGKVKVYSPDKGLLESMNCVNMILFHIFACMEENVVVSTFDKKTFCEVSYVLDNSKCKWTTSITEFIAKNSSFKVLLTDYASIRGFEFPNVITLLGSDYKFLKFRLVECLTRATTNLTLVLNHNVHELLSILKTLKDSKVVEYKVLCFDHMQDIYYFQSNDEIEKEILEQSVSAEPTLYNELQFRRDPERLYPWHPSKRGFRHETDYLKSTFEIIFKQDNVKLFEDLVHLHSIYVSEYEKSYKEYLLDFAKEYDASKLRTLICNQYTDKQLVAVTSIISHLFRDFSAYMLIKRGAQEYITPPLLCETPHHVAAAHNSDKVDYCADVNGFYIEHEAPLHIPSYYGSRNFSVTVREHINIQDKCTTDIDSLD